MKALSIRQPWAWLICAGWKDIENRNWKTDFRGRIYVHASSRWSNYPHSYRDLETIANGNHDLLAALVNYCAFDRNDPRKVGTIIGEVDIVDCVTESTSPWFVGKYGFILRNPKLYEKSIPYKGELGFFEPILGD